jgi:protein-S-isoprenylcysteine O-methyltransferase Ste14
MYVGYMMCAGAVGLISTSMIYLLVLYPFLFWWTHRFVIRYEEVALERRFGEAYRRYKQNVPRWIPRLTPYRDPS